MVRRQTYKKLYAVRIIRFHIKESHYFANLDFVEFDKGFAFGLLYAWRLNWITISLALIFYVTKKVGPFHVMDRIDLHSLQLLQPILATFEAY